MDTDKEADSAAQTEGCILCGKEALQRGLCKFHYGQFRRRKEMLPPSARKEFDDKSVEKGLILGDATNAAACPLFWPFVQSCRADSRRCRISCNSGRPPELAAPVPAALMVTISTTGNGNGCHFLCRGSRGGFTANCSVLGCGSFLNWQSSQLETNSTVRFPPISIGADPDRPTLRTAYFAFASSELQR